MFFYIIAILIAVSAVLVVTRVSPLASALWLVVCLFLQAVLYLFMGAHLVAALQVLLYAGAIMVLILFVIMLLNLSPKNLKWRAVTGERIIIGTGAVYLSAIFGMALAFIYKGSVIASSEGAKQSPENLFGTIESTGKILLTKYAIPFELLSVLLLVAIVGAIVTSRKSSSFDKPRMNGTLSKR